MPWGRMRYICVYIQMMDNAVYSFPKFVSRSEMIILDEL